MSDDKTFMSRVSARMVQAGYDERDAMRVVHAEMLREERAAVVRHLRFLARTTSIEEFRRAFNIAADHIEAACHHDIDRGEHVGS